MDKNEIALQLALKALDTGRFLQNLKVSWQTKEQLEEQNAFNAKQLSDFYNAILSQIK